MWFITRYENEHDFTVHLNMVWCYWEAILDKHKKIGFIAGIWNIKFNIQIFMDVIMWLNYCLKQESKLLWKL